MAKKTWISGKKVKVAYAFRSHRQEGMPQDKGVNSGMQAIVLMID